MIIDSRSGSTIHTQKLPGIDESKYKKEMLKFHSIQEQRRSFKPPISQTYQNAFDYEDKQAASHHQKQLNRNHHQQQGTPRRQ